MTDAEHVAAIQAAHRALTETIRAAEADGLMVAAELPKSFYGQWSLALTIRRTRLYAETDGQTWVEVPEATA